MYLSGHIIGLSYLSNKLTTITPSEFATIKFFGNCKIDDVHIVDYVLTDTNIANLDINVSPTFDSDTLLLAKFETGLNGGNLINVSSPITGWDVNRNVVGDTLSSNLGEVSATTTEFIDYYAQNGKQYIYNIFPKTATEIGEPLETDPITADLYSYSLADVDTGIVYLFDLNLSSDGYQNDTSFTEYETYARYNAFAIGERDFVRGNISAIAGTISTVNELIQPVDYLNSLRSFINNGTRKLFKDRKGRSLWVMTTGYKESPLDDGITCQPYVVSFNFIECANVEV